jgi:hypothetical protein
MKRIKIENCSVRIIAIAEPLGFKTLHQFEKFIKQCHPLARIPYTCYHERAEKVLKWIQREKEYL